MSYFGSRLKSGLRRATRRGAKPLRERLWWFDVVYPITVAALLFSSLTYVVYSGQRSSRLALIAEQKLVEYALRYGRGRAAPAPSGVLVVTADPLDVARYGRAPLGRAPEASVLAYARVVEALANAGVRSIYLRWDPDAHPADEVYYLPLEEALKRVKGRAEVTFAGPPNRMAVLPPGIAQNARVLDDATCIEAEKLATSCAFNPEWEDWIVPVLVTDILGPARPDHQPPWLTDQLPSVTPSFILNLPAPAGLTQLSFGDLLSGRAPPPARYAFVGTDPSRAISGAVPGGVTRFLRTAYDTPGVNVQVAGTPLHVFWAQLAQMLEARAMPVIPPIWLSVLTSIVLCIAIVVVMWRFGGPTAAGAFSVFVLSAPLLNGLALRHLDAYAPLVDSFYFGGSTFIFAGFGWLSYTAFQRWRLDEQQRMHALTADLKGNFIALLSHNLNTPVAKMQGMLALLSGLPGEQPWRADVVRAERQVAQLEYAIRSVLIAAAVEEGSITESSRNVKALMDEFARAMGPSLRRIGVRCVVEPPTADDDDLALYPLAFDVRALHSALAALVALFSRPERLVTVTVRPHVEPLADAEGGAERLRLVVTLASTDGWLPEPAARTLASTEARAVRSLSGASFLEDVLAGLASLVVRTYHGSVELRPAGDGGELTAAFVAGGGAETEAWH